MGFPSKSNMMLAGLLVILAALALACTDDITGSVPSGDISVTGTVRMARCDLNFVPFTPSTGERALIKIYRNDTLEESVKTDENSDIRVKLDTGQYRFELYNNYAYPVTYDMMIDRDTSFSLRFLCPFGTTSALNFGFYYKHRGDSLSREEEIKYIYRLCNNLPGCFDLSDLIFDGSHILEVDTFYWHVVDYWVPVTDKMYYWEIADSADAVLERDSRLYPESFYCGPSFIICPAE